MPASPERRLGDYLACPIDAIEAALERVRQAEEGGPQRIGQALLEAGAISREQLLTALYAQRVDRLGACPLFSAVSREALERLAPLVHETSAQPGERFITQEQVEPCFYVVVAGEVEIYRLDAEGEELLLGSALPGEPVGEMGYFAGGRRSASARALRRSDLIRIDYADLPRSFEIAPQLAIALLDTVTSRLRQRNVFYEETILRRRQAEESLRHLSELLDFTATTSLSHDVEKLIQQVVRTAARVMHADRASLFLVDPASGDLFTMVAEGERGRPIRVPAGSGIAGWVTQHGEILNIRDAYQDARFNREVDERTGYRTHSILCGPVRSLGGEIIGAVQVINKQEGSFGGDDETLFRAFCHQAAIAVENYNLYSKLVRSHQKMAVMLDVATSVSQTLDIRALIRKVVTKVTEVLACERASFFVLDRESDELWSMEAHGAELQEIRFPASEGLAGHVARSGELLNVAEAYEDLRFNPEVDRATGYRTHSVLSVPVTDRSGAVVGVTQAINRVDGRFERDDEDLLRALSSEIAVALENATLHTRTAEMKSYLENVQESISNAIVSLDPGGRVVTANRAALEIFGARPVGRTLAELGAGSSGPLLTLLDEAARSRRNAQALDVPLSLDGAAERTVNAHVFPLRATDGDHQGQVLVLEDVTRERRIRRTLNRYMAVEIVERMLADPEQQHLGGVRSKATILFSDIRDFTGLSESLSAEATMEFLNEYFTLMVDQVLHADGILDKFMGDALMAVFGVPFPQDDDARRAVRCALRMRDVLADYNLERAARNEPAVKIGIGINTGDVISGNIGSEERMDYTVIGDGVNVCSRLEALNKEYGTTLLVTAGTAAELGDDFLTRSLDCVLVKGRRRPVQVVEVLGESGAPRSEAHEAFAAGYSDYMARRFERAAGHFRAGAASDRPCSIFLARCEGFLREPPPPDWDGVWRPPGA